MKKIIILSLMCIFLLTGCGKLKTYQEISFNEYNKMIEEKQSFILFIGSETCSACAVYKEYLNEVIKDYQVEVKYIDLDKVTEDEYNKMKARHFFTGTPTTIFITDGEEKSIYNRIDGSKEYSKIVEKFKENGYIKGDISE